jgi:predicted nucleotidyltransferase
MFFRQAELPFRDIDLGVFYAGEDRVQMIEAADTLAIVLTRLTGYPVDVRVLNSAPASFVYHVIREELIYERNEDLRCQVVENTIRTYLDIEPILRRATKEAFSS